ncbi:hypothetical protein HYO37_22480 [Vibrio parahaemolyticus]|nr:hypothetical protein [Vibrio parahaemolyticus]
MSEEIDKVDSLKALEDVFNVDPRNEQYDLEEWHRNLAEISLNKNTPQEVKQLFENAKNIALYTYFSYRLHQSAETIAYSALEQALKLKFEQEQNNINFKKKSKRLEQYMDIALEQGWITNEGYESSRNIAAGRVEQRKVLEIIKSQVLEEGVAIPVPEPSESEILEEMRTMRVAENRLHAGRHVRNYLAHGNRGLAPTAFGTLTCIAEEINQLF